MKIVNSPLATGFTRPLSKAETGDITTGLSRNSYKRMRNVMAD